MSLGDKPVASEFLEASCEVLYGDVEKVAGEGSHETGRVGAGGKVTGAGGGRRCKGRGEVTGVGAWETEKVVGKGRGLGRGGKYDCGLLVFPRSLMGGAVRGRGGERGRGGGK